MCGVFGMQWCIPIKPDIFVADVTQSDTYTMSLVQNCHIIFITLRGDDLCDFQKHHNVT